MVGFGLNACILSDAANQPPLILTTQGTLPLGGEVYKVRTYGELVTSFINPAHVVAKDYLKTLEKEERKDAESPMASANNRMTVEQMIDIVEFLNVHYVKLVPDYEEPPYYGP